jgi:hypothetical protein
MDKNEGLLVELDHAEIAAVSGGMTLNQGIQRFVNAAVRINCEASGGAWNDTGVSVVCY